MKLAFSMIFRFALAALLSAAAPASTALDLPDPGLFPLLRQADRRLAIIGERLALSNVHLCSDRQPRIGVVLHALDQYQPTVRDAAKRVFGFDTPIAIEAVVPDGAAARAGVADDDGLVGVDGIPFAATEVRKDDAATASTRDAADRAIAQQMPSRPLTLQLVRHGAPIEVSVTPQPGCRVRFEVHDLDEAAADGATIQVGASYLDEFDDTQLAVIVAHELAHIILRHRARMDAAHVKYGVFSEFGKSGRLHRQAELEADRLSIYLLYNAGYDPTSGAAFWRGAGRKLDAGLFRNRAYPSWRERAALLENEASAIPASARAPYTPPIISLAHQPMR